MKLGYDLTIEQTQKLTMTPELIQAIQILQLNQVFLLVIFINSVHGGYVLQESHLNIQL